MAKTYGMGKPLEVLSPVKLELPNIPQATVPKQDFVPLGTPTAQDTVLPNQELNQNIETPSVWSTVKSSVAPTARDWYNALSEAVQYEPDPDYRPEADAQEFTDQYGLSNAREMAIMNAAQSYDEMKSLQGRILAQRDANANLAAHPVIGMAASLLDIDAVSLVVPNVGAVGTAGKLGRMGQRIAQGTVAGGVAYGINELTKENQTRSDAERVGDIINFGLLGVLTTPKAKPSVIDPTDVQAARLGAGIDSEITRLSGELDSVAARQGSIGEVDVLGTKIKVPISNQARTDLSMPDVSKKYGWAASLQSSADKMWHYTGADAGNPLNNLLASPRTQGDNAIYAAASYQAELDAKLVGIERAIDVAARTQSGYKAYLPFLRKEHTRQQFQVSEQFGQAMQRLDQDVIEYMNKVDGAASKEQIHKMINEAQEPEHIKAIMRTYVDSGFAEDALKLVRRSGLLDELDSSALIHSRPTYIPVKQSYDRIRGVIRSGVATEDEVAELIGGQIKRMFPDLNGMRWVNKEVIKDVGGKSVKTIERVQVPKNFRLTAKQLGKNFIQTQSDLRKGLSEVQTAGLTKDQMSKILAGTGIPADDLNHVVNQIYRGTQTEGTSAPKNFRKRLGWDFKSQYKTSGGTLSMGDLVDGNTFMNLSDYSRTMSHRMGAADYGIKSPSDFQAMTNELLDNLPPKVKFDEAKNFLKNVEDQIFGRPTGERLPEAVRAANTVAGSMLLSTSGLYSLNDFATQITKMGLLRSMPEMLKGMKNVIDPIKKLSKNEAKDLEDVLTGRLSMDGRWRDLTVRYSDDFDVSNGFYEFVEHAGQTTRFLNMSEYVKRMQIGTAVGAITTAFKGAAKGNAKDIAYMRKQLNMSPQLTDAIAHEYRLHGNKVDNWNNDVRMDMQQKVFYEVDNLAHTIRKGEIPAFMEHSSVGKVLFPFLSFAFAMQQKVLRNTYQRDGAAGVALLAAVQFPTALAIAMAKNVKNGKEYDEDLAAGAVNAVSIAGAFSIPIGMIMSGQMGGSAAAAPIDGALGIMEEMKDGKGIGLDSLAHAPLLGSFSGLNLLLNNLED